MSALTSASDRRLVGVAGFLAGRARVVVCHFRIVFIVFLKITQRGGSTKEGNLVT